MSEIINILMIRDGLDYEAARETYLETKREICDTFSGESVLTPEDVLLGIGLEIDYIFDFI